MYIAIYFTKEEKNKINDGKYTNFFRPYLSSVFSITTNNSKM